CKTIFTPHSDQTTALLRAVIYDGPETQDWIDSWAPLKDWPLPEDSRRLFDERRRLFQTRLAERFSSLLRTGKYHAAGFAYQQTLLTDILRSVKDIPGIPQTTIATI